MSIHRALALRVKRLEAERLTGDKVAVMVFTQGSPGVDIDAQVAAEKATNPRAEVLVLLI
jgi:hypothetical protein